MECKNAQSLIDGYLDRELDPARSLEVEEHLRACSLCNQNYQDHQNLRDVFKNDALYFKAPAQLQQRVQRAVRQAAKTESAPRWRTWSWIRVAAPMAAAALVVLTLLPYLVGPSNEELLSEEVISGHIRSLMADHLADVASSDRHTVRPWFSGKLDFSPPVEDLAAMGFPLIGGRLDYLHDRAVAALIYRRDKHLINVFVWPSAKTARTAQTKTARQGYNLSHWTDSGLNFWVVSDLERDQLEKFVELLRAPPAPAS
jgi:anti-sigma factor RsiW